MVDDFQQASGSELETGFPRFLNRDPQELPPHLQPPPLPRIPWWRQGVAIARFAIGGATTLGAIAVVSAPLLTAKRAPVAAVVAAPVLVDGPREIRSDIAAAVEIVSALESRLSFGANLATQSVGTGPAPGLPLAGETSPPAESDAIAALMMRAEPDIVQPVAAASDGQSVWVAPASDAGSLALSLGRAGEEQASAAAAPAAQTSGPTRASGNGNDEGAAAKPVKRRHRLQVRKVVTVAQDETRPKRRVGRADDAHKSRNSDPAFDSNAEAKAAAQDEQEKPAGPISKFFAWLKSGAKKPANDDEKPTGFGLSPQE